MSLTTTFAGPSWIDSSLFVINGLVPLRTINVASASINELARFVGTIISDYENRVYRGTDYTVMNPSADRTYDCLATSLGELLAVVGTIVTDNPARSIVVTAFTVNNLVEDFQFDVTATSLAEIANILGTFIASVR